MNPRDHIKSISLDYSANDRVRDSLEGAMRHVQRSFSRRGHLLMEFIQNAEDSGSSKMHVQLEEAGLVIRNNGTPFTEGDVDSLCKIGKSSKAGKGYLGYLGVGFKSTFLVADHVTIHSGDYHFSFDRAEQPSGSPWQIMPFWTDTGSFTQNPWTTTFSLGRLSRESIQTLRSSFRLFQPRTLLWLENLDSLVIGDGVEQKRFEKVHLQGDCWRLIIQDGGSTLHEDWLVVKGDYQVPEDIRSDPMTKDWERDHVDARTVAAAFRLDESGNIVPEAKGAAYITIYSYTPMYDESVPLRFLVQGDFITSPNRESVQRESKWNKWLADKLLDLLTDKCSSLFLNHLSWKYQFQLILDVEDAGNHPIWDECLRKPLHSFISEATIFPAHDDKLITQAEAIRVPDNMQSLITDRELATLFPTLKRVNSQVDFDIQTAPSDSLQLILHSEAEVLLQGKARYRSVKWFKRLCSGLTDYLPFSNYRKSQLRGAAPFVLTENGALSAVDEALLRAPRVRIPSMLIGQLPVVHPRLLRGSEGKLVRTVLEGLGTKTLDQDLVRRTITEKQLPIVREQWVSMDAASRISCLDLFRQHSIDSKQLDFVSLPTKSGVWQEPTKLLFSKEFHPNIDVESLLDVGVLNKDDCTEEFLAANFPGLKDPDDFASWNRFFTSLGVGNSLDQARRTQLAQRVGTKVAILYERARGSSAKELPESESHLKGYDIESKGKGGTRRIATNRSIPGAMPPWGGAPYSNASSIWPNRALISSFEWPSISNILS